MGINLTSDDLLGATVRPEGARFRVWAPKASAVEVELYGTDGPTHHSLSPVGDGYFAGLVERAGAGSRYRYRLDGAQAYPDPASRSQPEDVHGPSEVVDPSAFGWTDHDWPGLARDDSTLTIYELHVGTFSPAGTFDGAIDRLGYLAELGVTAIELMPVAEFPGARNWGYDGVDLFAPESSYGGPAGLKRLVDAAHRAGLGVLLDVVYNHFGPDGNYLAGYADDYFTDRYDTPWGQAVNYDGPNSEHVRALVLQNVRHWLDEYHLDGLRLDATHAIFDDSPRHILAEIAAVAHGRERPAIVIAEDHRNEVKLFNPPERGGYGLDGVWADDFHHALRTYLTDEQEGYYRSFSGSLADLATTIESGFLYQGQVQPANGKPRGTRVDDQPARAFVVCSENHDQVGNRAFGERLAHLVDPERYLLASAALLLSPETVLLFQGQEFAASTPFLYFTNHTAELGRLVTEGRREEFKGFRAFRDPAVREQIPDPQAGSTFEDSVLDLAEREQNAEVLDCYRRLLALRRDDPIFRRADRQATRAYAPGPHLLAIHRWQGTDHRLVLLNFGDAEASIDPAALEGLPLGRQWRIFWAAGDPALRRRAWDGARWTIPARSGVALG